MDIFWVPLVIPPCLEVSVITRVVSGSVPVLSRFETRLVLVLRTASDS